ncbi:MAG: glycosyltransferase [Eubacterium sp.]|nr:glycosyltransferase [Eubacterium sp.]
MVENLNKKYSNIKTIIVGSSKSGTNNIDSYTSDVIVKIKKLGNKVKFTGYIKYKELGNIYNVAVFPAIWEEPAGLTIIEAMAYKIPVITTYSGGIVEYTDKNSSILCNKDER